MTRSSAADPLYLGIDTGGTYTDAVLWSPEHGLVAKAKALTTRHDLAEGIAEAAGRVMDKAQCEPGSIALVSMSTTLATNALVEGHGGRAALVMIGFDDADIKRAGLSEAIGSDPLIRCAGGHDVHGRARPLELSALESALDTLQDDAGSVAICSYFAVRNPEHEIHVRDLVYGKTGLPVTCSFELSSKLGGPKRALTTLLNARLISTITRLVEATQRFLMSRSIDAPLMIVRGDGALVLADVAIAKPIETILSGPAASVVGAHHLTGHDKAIVSDIGGTTTDIAILQDGRPRIEPDGAIVGGYRTMVEAVAMQTFGLGGDSEVQLEPGGLVPRILLGPGRIVPLSLLATKFPEFVHATLDRQLGSDNTGRQDGRLAFLTGSGGNRIAGLSTPEKTMLEQLSAGPVALDRLIDINSKMAHLKKLVAKGLVHISGVTPSDAAHVRKLQDNWDMEAAIKGTDLFARRRDGRGKAVAENGSAISEMILSAVKRRSAEVILATAMDEDGLDGASTVALPIVQNALDGKPAIGAMHIALDRPVIGLGASARLHYSGLDRILGTDVDIPDDSDVANALGAVVGQVRVKTEAIITQPQPDRFHVTAGEVTAIAGSQEGAIAMAEELVREHAKTMAEAAGAAEPAIRVSRDIRTASVEDREMFVEALITAVASGRPRIANENSA